MPQLRQLTACTLWVVAIIFMVFGTIDSTAENRTTPLLAWGLFVAGVALVPTGWCLLCKETATREDELERIVRVVDALHEAKRDLHSV